MANKFFDSNWWKDLSVAIIATTVSILLTFGTASLVNRWNQKKERELTAMMVMSSIESFARQASGTADLMDHADTVVQYLLRLPVDRLEEIPNKLILGLLNDDLHLPYLNHDQSAESIFNSGIETWKNMGNFQFIDNVGQTFSTINQIEKNWNDWVMQYHQQFQDSDTKAHNASADHLGAFLLRDGAIRVQLGSVSNMVDWLHYCVAVCRQLNLVNMSLIGISEEEVNRFTDSREEGPDPYEAAVDFNDFIKPVIPLDSMYTMKSVQEQIDAALKGGK